MRCSTARAHASRRRPAGLYELVREIFVADTDEERIALRSASINGPA